MKKEFEIIQIETKTIKRTYEKIFALVSEMVSILKGPMCSELRNEFIKMENKIYAMSDKIDEITKQETVQKVVPISGVTECHEILRTMDIVKGRKN